MSTLKTRKRPATYADIEALPSNMVGEIIFDALYAHPRPAPRHAVAAVQLGYEVTGPYRFGRGGPGGWIFMVEPELRLGSHVAVPDIAGWKVEKLTPFPTTAWIETPPDWLCEVLSPSTQALDRTDKLAVYAEFKVPYCWYADPIAKTLEVFSLTAESKWLLAESYREAGPVAAPPFEAHTFSLEGLWAPDS